MVPVGNKTSTWVWSFNGVALMAKSQKQSQWTTSSTNSACHVVDIP